MARTKYRFFQALRAKRTSKFRRARAATNTANRTIQGNAVPEQDNGNRDGEALECPNFILLGYQQKKHFKDIYKGFVRYGIVDHGKMVGKMQALWTGCQNHTDGLKKYWLNLQVEQRGHFRMLRRKRMITRRNIRNATKLGLIQPADPDKEAVDQENPLNADIDAVEQGIPTLNQNDQAFKFRRNSNFESIMNAWQLNLREPEVPKAITPVNLTKPFRSEVSIGELLALNKKGNKGRAKGGKHHRKMSNDLDDTIADQLGALKLGNTEHDGDEEGKVDVESSN
ncbi:hypothetical protein TWF569_005345 [Orbilia oligospora]|uniref:Uncharacterized protein n=1 Tax=Orbilia oligospora TaxID=2813651 RepID=A0A7C8NAG6_ORBOL|nr:hypothetical protein TWF103_000753 [Orbilia oligospora]KAF3099179.1 hypothetical protein TWF102_005585 [Orbilia oligospora]KAF3107862.1 hypothetical protein TWF706_002670 [Orbilia oligospora]KAF3125905.1 hypothetical protein TWF594_001306 [Orbilia oligospora]KAF3126697.1 hypothetical protein TWF703_010380 [Orbilia oligospora]